ncbi:VOC family protein [Shewanella sp.]|uniref:VOC family protein n=1 Tax=Shewanella sp. TaxID=50422 RepID=UPI003A96AA7C
MSQCYQQLQSNLAGFSTNITALINDLGLVSLTQCDHAAVRVNTAASADELSQALQQHGEIISNNIINGRPILIIKLQQPLTIAGRSVSCIELPYPNKPYPQEGWEHVELVLPEQAQDCQQLQQQLLALSPMLSEVFAGNSDIKVKASSPSAATERLANPTIAFKRGGVCVKVHPHTIEAIIASEQSS